MSKKLLYRRDFISKAASAIAGVAITGGLAKASTTSAASYKKIIGSNERLYFTPHKNVQCFYRRIET